MNEENRIGTYREGITGMLNDFSDTNKTVTIRTSRSSVVGELSSSPELVDEGIVYFVEKYILEYKVHARVSFSIEDLVQITVKENYTKEGDNYVNMTKIDIYVEKFI